MKNKLQKLQLIDVKTMNGTLGITVNGFPSTYQSTSSNGNVINTFEPLDSVKNFLNDLASALPDHSSHHHNSAAHDPMNSGNQMLENNYQLTVGHYHIGEEMHAHGHHTAADHLMKMWFHSGHHEIILFEFWQIDSIVGLLISCLLIFTMACSYEGIKWLRVHLQLCASRCPPGCGKSSNQLELAEDKCTGCRSASVPLTNGVCTRTRNKHMTSAIRLLQAVLYLIQLTLAYWLMLIAMTYNVWLTAAVITGAAFGHWLFAILKCFNPQNDELDAFATDACH